MAWHFSTLAVWDGALYYWHGTVALWHGALIALWPLTITYGVAVQSSAWHYAIVTMAVHIQGQIGGG